MPRGKGSSDVVSTVEAVDLSSVEAKPAAKEKTPTKGFVAILYKPDPGNPNNGRGDVLWQITRGTTEAEAKADAQTKLAAIGPEFAAMESFPSGAQLKVVTLHNLARLQGKLPESTRLPAGTAKATRTVFQKAGVSDIMELLRKITSGGIDPTTLLSDEEA